MPTKFYFHDATVTGLAGTLPGATNLAGLTVTTTATGASTNRSMNTTIGASQTSIALTTSAVTTSQGSWFRRFILSTPLDAQILPTTLDFTLRLAASESNAASDMFEEQGACGITIWNPVAGSTRDRLSGAGGGTLMCLCNEPSTSETSCTGTNTDILNPVVVLRGDLLVVEIFSVQSQTMAVGYTNTVFYDGTTELSTTSNAAHIEFSQDISLMAPRSGTVNFQDPGVLMRRLPWHRRRTGIFVPDLPRLWTPSPQPTLALQ